MTPYMTGTGPRPDCSIRAETRQTIPLVENEEVKKCTTSVPSRTGEGTCCPDVPSKARGRKSSTSSLLFPKQWNSLFEMGPQRTCHVNHRRGSAEEYRPFRWMEKKKSRSTKTEPETVGSAAGLLSGMRNRRVCSGTSADSC